MRLITRKRLAGVFLTGMFTAGLVSPAFATGETPPPPTKCNSGRGNSSESTPATDCDPGNSGGHNNGGD